MLFFPQHGATRSRERSGLPRARRMVNPGTVIGAVTMTIGLTLSGCSAIEAELDALLGTAEDHASDTGSGYQVPELEYSGELALDVLERLPVKGRAPKTGYSREEFGPRWPDVDRNGCDTRNDILQRDLTVTSFRPEDGECIVLTGILEDAYTGTTIEFRRGEETSQEVQIDHVVALSDAWQTGAQQLSASEREAFANDPANLQAVDGAANSQKGDSNAASWLPPHRAYRCTYVSRQISVKERYDLWVLQPEKDAMRRVLDTCTEQQAYKLLYDIEKK